MPRIAQIQFFQNQPWVRLEGLSGEQGSVSIYTETEVEQLKRDVALAITDQILQMYPKPSA